MGPHGYRIFDIHHLNRSPTHKVQGDRLSPQFKILGPAFCQADISVRRIWVVYACHIAPIRGNMLYLKFIKGVSMILTPLPLLTALTFLVGFMSLLMGLLAEMLVRTYFESQGRSAYHVRELTNFPEHT